MSVLEAKQCLLEEVWRHVVAFFLVESSLPTMHWSSETQPAIPVAEELVVWPVVVAAA